MSPWICGRYVSTLHLWFSPILVCIINCFSYPRLAWCYFYISCSTGVSPIYPFHSTRCNDIFLFLNSVYSVMSDVVLNVKQNVFVTRCNVRGREKVQSIRRAYRRHTSREKCDGEATKYILRSMSISHKKKKRFSFVNTETHFNCGVIWERRFQRLFCPYRHDAYTLLHNLIELLKKKTLNYRICTRTKCMSRNILRW